MSNHYRIRNNESIEAALTNFISTIPEEFRQRPMNKGLFAVSSYDLRSVTCTFGGAFDPPGLCKLACEMVFSAYGSAKELAPLYVREKEYAVWVALRDFARILAAPKQFPDHYFEADGFALLEEKYYV